MRTLFLLFPSAGPMFFLSCFSFAVGIAMLYYYGGESYRKMEKRSDFPWALKSLLNIKNYQCTKVPKAPSNSFISHLNNTFHCVCV